MVDPDGTQNERSEERESVTATFLERDGITRVLHAPFWVWTTPISRIRMTQLARLATPETVLNSIPRSNRKNQMFSRKKNALDVAQHHYAAKNCSAAHVCVPEKICNSRPSFEFSMKDLRIKLTEIIANYKASKPLKMKKICGQNEEKTEAINGGKRK